MNKGFVLERCIYCEVLFINYKGDYPFCEDCMLLVEKGFDTSTIPTEKFRQVKRLLEV